MGIRSLLGQREDCEEGPHDEEEAKNEESVHRALEGVDVEEQEERGSEDFHKAVYTGGKERVRPTRVYNLPRAPSVSTTQQCYEEDAHQWRSALRRT